MPVRTIPGHALSPIPDIDDAQPTAAAEDLVAARPLKPAMCSADRCPVAI